MGAPRKPREKLGASLSYPMMEGGGRKGSSSPLLEPSPSSSSATGSASSIQTLGNIIVSIVGTGVLGLPFAFKIAGWLAGAAGVIIAGVSTYYCMLILVSDTLLFFFLFPGSFHCQSSFFFLGFCFSIVWVLNLWSIPGGGNMTSCECSVILKMAAGVVFDNL